MRSWFQALFAPFGIVRGFVTVPGLISLGGLLLALVTLWADRQIQLTYADRQFAWLIITNEGARQILSTVAASAMAALSLVYSTVLVVFTLAAGTIAPRLLQRFSADRTSQAAVGLLGASFLFCLMVMHAVEGERIPEISMTTAMVLAVLSVLMLLLFVNKAARRVTIDEEIAAIGQQLDKHLAIATQYGSNLMPDAVIRPDGPDFPIIAEGSGYVVRIGYEDLASIAAASDVFVDLDVLPGDYVIAGQQLGLAVGTFSQELAHDICCQIILDHARTPADDLRFSTDLLVEIGLRALSPGVNDTYTAIACADRLSSSLRAVQLQKLATGVFTGPDGAARLVVPNLSASALIQVAFGPFRRAARGNILMTRHLVMALGRLGQGEGLPGEDAIREQLALVAAETKASPVLDEDKRLVERLIETALKTQVGQPLPQVPGSA
jgi:uncharacterized membrane protein